MIRAYDEMYIEGAMIRLGDMMEYACLDCHYDPDSFFKMFIQSGLATSFGIGHVSYVAGKSGPELAFIVMEEVDNRLDFPEPTWRSYRTEYFWAGWVLAYFQWHENMSFKKIWESVSIRTLLKMYPTYHEADITKAVDEIKRLIKPPMKTKLVHLRIFHHMTQQELADKAKMSLSQYQRLEYGERKIENLTLKTALNLANALGIEVDEME